MKRLFCAMLCVLVLSSCGKNPTTNSSDITSKDTSSVSIVEHTSSDESSQITSSQEEIYVFSIDAKTAVKRIQAEIPFTADAVEIDRRFVLEKAGVSEDMYEDFYGEMSYETADNSFIAVFCCKTTEKSESLKLKLNQALANEDKLSHLSPDAKIFSANGYVFFIVTQNNFDEENLVSKLIQ